jgi:hypothetical protein
MQPCVSNGFLEKGKAMLVILVCPIMSEIADPVARNMSDERCGHGIQNPQ